MTNVVRLIVSQSAVPVRGCGTCRSFVRRELGPPADGCEATGGYASNARKGACLNGQLWEPLPAHVPILIRFKRWLVG